MSEMLKRCARALAVADEWEWERTYESVGDGERAGWKMSRGQEMKTRIEYRDAARAVLTALREPSEEMMKAGGETFTRRGFMTVDFEGQPYLAFQAMIDSALAPDVAPTTGCADERFHAVPVRKA